MHHATTYTQPARTTENRNMTGSTVMGIPRLRLSRVACTLLGAVLLIALPASLGAQQRVLVLDKSLVTVAEGNGTATYTVRLNTQPTGTVTVIVASSDTKAATVDRGTLTFEPSDWDEEQHHTVMVIGGADDQVANPGGGRFPEIKHTPSGGGFSTPKTLAVVVTDDNIAGLIFVTDPVTVTVTEKGSATVENVDITNTNDYTVALRTKPTGTVTVFIVSSDTSAATVSPATLTFTPSNWNDQQTVMVTGVDDREANINQLRSPIIAHTASGGGYDSITGEVKVMVLDSGTTPEQPGGDLPGLLVVPALLSVAEARGTATYTMRLSTKPREGTVTVDVASNDTTAATVTPGLLTFTTSNWDRQQTITVTGVDDNKDNDSDQRVATISHTPKGVEYDLLEDSKSVIVTVIDDDKAGLEIPSSISVSESGDKRYTVRLSTKPADKVIVEIAEDLVDSTVSLSLIPTSLTFTVDDWNLTQTVTVTGDKNDMIVNPGRSVVLRHANSGYLASADVLLTVNINDNDPAEIKVTPSRLTVNEDDSITYSIELTSFPLTELTFTAMSSDPDVEIVMGSPTLEEPKTFTVTVSVPDDMVAKGERVVTIKHEHSCVGCGYEGSEAGDVTVTVKDNDTPTVNVSRRSRTVTEGGTATYTVRLRTQPTEDEITVDVTSGAPRVATVMPKLLTFTRSNWNAPQTVTIMGVNDDVANTGRSRSTSIDNTAKGITSQVTVKVNDNDPVQGIKFVKSVADPTTINSLGDSGSYAVVLKSNPDAGTVVVTLVSDNPGVTVTPQTVTFRQGVQCEQGEQGECEQYWGTPQSVTVDLDPDPDHDKIGKPSGRIRAVITHTPNGGGVDARDLGVTVTKDDSAELLGILDGQPDMIDEGASTSRYIMLSAPPAIGNTVTVNMSSDPRIATVSPTSLKFTLANWEKPQTVTVTGVPDLTRGPRAAPRKATVRFTPSGGGYRSTHAKSIVVTVTRSMESSLFVSPLSVEVSEGQTTRVEVGLNTQPTGDVTVTVASTDPNAATVEPDTLTFTRSNSDRLQAVTVTAVNDDKVNATGKRSPTIMFHSSGANYQGKSASVEVTVKDDDANVTVAPAAVTVPEAGGRGTYTMKLDGQPTGNVTVTVASSNASAAAVTPGSLTFTPSNWNAPQTVTVTGVDDSIRGDRSATITHTASGGGYDDVEVGSVSVTVTDDDGMIFSRRSVTVAEADGSATYTVRLQTQPAGNVTVTVASSNASAAAVTPESLTFTPSNWNAPQTVTVTGVDDDLDNGLSRSAEIAHTGYGSPENVTVRVTDDEDAPTLEIRGGEAIEGNTGTTPLRFTVAKHGATDQVVTVAYADADTGTATAGTDYTAIAAGTLTFARDETSKTITVMVRGDDVSEPDETVVIALRSPPSNATIAEGSATGTIIDDDASRLSIKAGATSVDEGESLIFTVSLDPPIAAEQVTVEVVTGGTATAGADYTGVPETLTFAAGEGSKTITVAVVDDADYELDETVEVELSNQKPTGSVAIETGKAMVTIEDNDDPPALSISGTSIAEGNDGTTNKLTFEVTKSGGTSMEATVAYADAGTGTATAGTDYTAIAAGTLTFAPDETSKTITVVVKGDDESEGDETVVIALRSSSPHATIAEGKGTATGTIIDDDILPRVATDWLARFGRTAAGATLDAIARRMNDGAAGVEPALTVAGRRAAFAPGPVAQAAVGTAAPWEEGWARALTIEELANGSSFDAGANFVEGLSVWGASSYNQFEMTPQGAYTMDGSLVSAILGVDHQGDGYVAGLALAYHGGAGDFSGFGKTEGSLGTNLYSVHPYARLTFGEAFHVGGSFGIGTGDLSITDKDGAALVETGVGMPVLAALDARMELSLAEAWILALQADGHLVQMVADEQLPRFTRVETNTHRLRLGVENSYVFRITDGVRLAPVLETGLRYDGGDAGETGLGFDVGGGLRLDATVVGLMVDARGHASLSNWGEGQEQAPMLRDWGLGGVIRWRPAGGGMGPEMSLSPAYGGTLGAEAPSLNAEIGYRMAAFGGVFTPYSAAEFGNGQQSYRAGAHFEIGQGIALSAEGTHRQSAIGDGDQSLTLEMRLRQ